MLFLKLQLLKNTKFTILTICPFMQTWPRNICSQLNQDISIFWLIYSIQGTEKKHIYSSVDQGWRKSMLPSLARFLLCLVRVGVPWVSWAVRYLDKLRWRAVDFRGVDGWPCWIMYLWLLENIVKVLQKNLA